MYDQRAQLIIFKLLASKYSLYTFHYEAKHYLISEELCVMVLLYML